MAANEDYLDSLLKAAMDSDKKDDPNRPLTPEEIEAMFASAGSDAELSADGSENAEMIGATEPVQNESTIDNKILEDTPDDSAAPIAELLSDFDSIKDLDAEPRHAQSQTEQSEQPEQFEQPEQSEQSEQFEQPEQFEQSEQFEQPQQPEGKDTEKDSHSEMEFDLDSMDDIDELLGLKEMPEDYKEDRKNGGSDQIADETNLEKPDLENQDLTDLLELLGEDNDDLAEINDILKKSDNNEIVDNTSIQELENAMSADPADTTSKEEEDSGKEKKKGNKKKKRLFGRKNKKDDVTDVTNDTDAADGGEVADGNVNHENTELDDIAADFEALSDGAESVDVSDASQMGKKKEKNGFFKKLIQVLTEEIDDEPETEEDPEAPKKKGKKEKKGKKKKSAETNEELLEEMAEEDEKALKEKKKQKKPKKEKKEKKKKEKIKIEDAGAQDEKKIPKKMVVRIFVLGFSILAVVAVLAAFTPKIISLQKAHSLFYKGDYKNAYKELIAQKSLGESDSILLEKSALLTELDNKNSLYQAYSAADMALEGVNTLLDGIDCYQKNIDRYAQYGISYEAELFYEKFMTELAGKYGLTAEQVNEILQMDSVAYTYKLREITNTTGQSQDSVPGENPAVVSANDIQGGENPDQDVNNTSMADPLVDELE